MSEPTLEDRVTRLEELLDKLIARARLHPVGRALLRQLGIE
jgi:hypothetical protein